jgi:diguanylate cyclase (GGDEF)-like protein/PAS domain S-box-containing protein
VSCLPGDLELLKEATELYQKIVCEVADGIIAVDEAGVIRLCNPAVERIFGYPPGQLIGKPLDILLPAAARPGHSAHLEEFARGTADARNMGQRPGSIRGLKIDGTEVDLWATILRTRTSAGLMMVAVIRDFTDALTQQRELQRLADTDSLTALLNRRAFLRAADQSMTLSVQSRSPFAVAIFDLDHFKGINDTYGHAAGDTVLAAFANILSNQSRRHDLVARWGGEEFVLFLPQTEMTAARKITEQICKTVGEFPFPTGSQPSDPTVGLTVSCGLACYSYSQVTLQTLISRADDSLYEAKRRGRNCIVTTIEAANEHANIQYIG